MRRRIFRLYGELKLIELEFEASGRSASEAMLSRLEQLEERANLLRVSHAFATLLYTLRVHLNLVLSQLKP